jgi:pimeloyl-ACP methyl ester carboxylesterase
MFLQLKPISVAGSIPGSSSYDCATTADRYAAAGAQIEIIEDAGHSPHVERPAQVGRLLREFLAKNAN